MRSRSHLRLSSVLLCFWRAPLLMYTRSFRCRWALARQQLTAAQAAWKEQCKLVRELRQMMLTPAAAEEMGKEVRAAATGGLLTCRRALRVEIC